MCGTVSVVFRPKKKCVGASDGVTRSSRDVTMLLLSSWSEKREEVCMWRRTHCSPAQMQSCTWVSLRRKWHPVLPVFEWSVPSLFLSPLVSDRFETERAKLSVSLLSFSLSLSFLSFSPRLSALSGSCLIKERPDRRVSVWLHAQSVCDTWSIGGQRKYRPLAVDRMRITSILLRVYLCWGDP